MPNGMPAPRFRRVDAPVRLAEPNSVYGGQAAPAWLDVRGIDLPGHGKRAVDWSSSLPPFAARQLQPLSRTALGVELAKLVVQLADELEPLLRMPYVLMGFSVGAQLCYYLTLEFQRRKLRSPLMVLALSCVPPHCIWLPDHELSRMQRASSMLKRVRCDTITYRAPSETSNTWRRV